MQHDYATESGTSALRSVGSFWTAVRVDVAMRVSRRIAVGLFAKLGDLRFCMRDDLQAAALEAMCLRAGVYDESKATWEDFCGIVGWQGAQDYVRRVRRPGRSRMNVLPDTDDRVEELFDAAVAPNVTSFRAESSEVLAAVSRLPEPYREAVALYYLHGLTDAEIAAQSGATRSTVSLRRRCAIAWMRLALYVEPDRRRIEYDALGGTMQKAVRGLFALAA